EDHVRSDNFSGVCGRTAHQGEQRAGGGLFAVVDRLAGADGGEHLVVLDLVHVAFSCLGPAIAPGGRATDRIAEDIGRALGAEQVVLGLSGRIDPVAALMIAANVVRVLVHQGEMVPDVAVLGIGAGLAAADAPAANRQFVAHDPAHGVKPVDGLLDDVVAGKPAVVVPVAHLVLHVGATLLARLAGVP